jgi:hypothetical protein
VSHPVKYKLKHRLPPISRLCRYEHLPPPLKDDPPRDWTSWEERCVKVYRWMIARKYGVPLPVPDRERRGLWFHAA